MSTKPSVEIKVGQVWEDADPRASGRQIRIMDILPESGKVKVQTIVLPGGQAPQRPVISTIRIDRLRPGSTGYKLVWTPTETSDPKPESPGV